MTKTKIEIYRLGGRLVKENEVSEKLQAKRNPTTTGSRLSKNFSTRRDGKSTLNIGYRDSQEEVGIRGRSNGIKSTQQISNPANGGCSTTSNQPALVELYHGDEIRCAYLRSLIRVRKRLDFFSCVAFVLILLVLGN